MKYEIRTSGTYYKEWPHTRRLEKVWFKFRKLTKDESDWTTILKCNCCLYNQNIEVELSDAEVIKLSKTFEIILRTDNTEWTIIIYDWYRE